jgi:uncharacterized protein YgbK (DUF1537 family)
MKYSPNRLLLAFYGDDFTGSTDALEQLTLAGIRTALFIAPPSPEQVAAFGNIQAVGVAGLTRSMKSGALKRELRPVLKQLKALRARHVHYKVCSTFDSSPTIGSVGRVIDLATKIFPGRFIPLLVAAPRLGRYCVFGNLFARFGIGSDGDIHRLDRHPSISKHPITPMTESDLGRHLGRQTRKRIGLFDILKLGLPLKASRAVVREIADNGAEVVLFDALSEEHLFGIGELIDSFGGNRRTLFSVGSSGVETALAAHWRRAGVLDGSASSISRARPVQQILVASGSWSPVTAVQIRSARANGFAECELDVAGLAAGRHATKVVADAAASAIRAVKSDRSVIVHTGVAAPHPRFAASMRGRSARLIGDALGSVLRAVLAESRVRRICVAGGDTSSYAARALGIQALQMTAVLTPGAPLCRVSAPGASADGCEIVFKGGQVGPENYFEIVRRGRA